MNEAKNFIDAIERREEWTVSQHGAQLQKRAFELADKILVDTHSAREVPAHTWILFLAVLPFSKSLSALSDLSLLLKGVLNEIVKINDDDPDDVLIGRDVIIGRLNILLRKDLHDSVLTEQRRATINSILGLMNGSND
jgi:hypothetical protein